MAIVDIMGSYLLKKLILAPIFPLILALLLLYRDARFSPLQTKTSSEDNSRITVVLPRWLCGKDVSAKTSRDNVFGVVMVMWDIAVVWGAMMPMLNLYVVSVVCAQVLLHWVGVHLNIEHALKDCHAPGVRGYLVLALAISWGLHVAHAVSLGVTTS